MTAEPSKRGDGDVGKTSEIEEQAVELAVLRHQRDARGDRLAGGLKPNRRPFQMISPAIKRIEAEQCPGHLRPAGAEHAADAEDLAAADFEPHTADAVAAFR